MPPGSGTGPRIAERPVRSSDPPLPRLTRLELSWPGGAPPADDSTCCPPHPAGEGPEARGYLKSREDWNPASRPPGLRQSDAGAMGNSLPEAQWHAEHQRLTPGLCFTGLPKASPGQGAKPLFAGSSPVNVPSLEQRRRVRPLEADPGHWDNPDSRFRLHLEAELVFDAKVHVSRLAHL